MTAAPILESAGERPAEQTDPITDWKSIDYAKVIEERLRRLEFIRSDRDLLQAAKVYYRDNHADFVNDWIWTYDPRRTDLKHVPMVLWTRQREFLEWLAERRRTRTSGLVEKSRDMGVTNLALGDALADWLFVPESKSSFGSRKEALVDRLGDPDSIFEKARMMLRMLPAEFLPKGYDERQHATFMKLINPENGATITGEAGDNIGRGGRSGIYYVDEAAFLEHPERVDAALSENTDVRIDISSANGNANPFYQKRQSGRLPVFTFHWRSDPRKDEAWYERKKRELDPWIVASEIDIDYCASVEGVCIPATYVLAAVGIERNENLSREFRERLSRGMRRAGLDIADEGGDANAYAEVTGVKLTHLEQWREGTPHQTTRRANDIARARNVKLIRFDRPGVGAGARGEFAELKAKGVAVPFEAVNTGAPPPPGRCEESGVLNAERYKNLRAWLWWSMRRRCIRTYEHVNGIRTYEPEQLLALPAQDECPLVMEFVSELSSAKAFFNDAGMIQIEAKKDLKRRGSPNLADAFLMNFIVKKVFNPLKHIH